MALGRKGKSVKLMTWRGRFVRSFVYMLLCSRCLGLTPAAQPVTVCKIVAVQLCTLTAKNGELGLSPGPDTGDWTRFMQKLYDSQV